MIQKSLSSLNYDGVTGPITFDSKGNRADTCVLKSIKNGIPVTAGKE
jgi:ABC-type branched-subunit amino acid transport system substrate-binding protein